MHKESITHLHCLWALCLAGAIRKLGGRCVEVSMDESHNSRTCCTPCACGGNHEPSCGSSQAHVRPCACVCPCVCTSTPGPSRIPRAVTYRRLTNDVSRREDEEGRIPALLRSVNGQYTASIRRKASRYVVLYACAEVRSYSSQPSI